MHRTLTLLALAAALAISGCQDSGSSGDYVPFKQTARTASEPDVGEGIDAAAGSATSAPASTDNAPVNTLSQNTPAAEQSPQPAAAPTDASETSTTTADTNTANTGNSTANPDGSIPLVTSEQSGLSGPADRPNVENTASAEQRPIQLLIPSKRFRKERPSNALRLSYDDIDLLKVLNMEPVPPDAVAHFPDWLKQLDGQTIRIRGYMYPTFEATGLTSFTLARDNGICCFVRQPKIYDIISVALAPGEVSDYIANRPFDVEGVFRIDPGADQTDLSRLYRIDQAKVLN